MATLDLIDLGDENWGTRQNANLTALNNAKQEIATLGADVAGFMGDTSSDLRIVSNDLYNPRGVSTGLPTPITSGTSYESWPAIVQAETGRIIVTYSAGASSHGVSASRNLYCIYSDDLGVTWSAPVTVVSDATWDYACFGIGQDSAGNILAWVRRRSVPGGATNAMILYRSTNYGQSWSSYVTPSLSTQPELVMNIAVTPTGRMIAAYHGDTSYTYGFLISDDDGATWSQLEVEDAGGDAGWAVETELFVHSDGRILGLARTQVEDAPLIQLQSDDDGDTWTKADTNILDQLYSKAAFTGDENSLTIYYSRRDTGVVSSRTSTFDHVWDSPTSWPAPVVVSRANPTTQDNGQINATNLLNDESRVVYYSGTPGNTRIFLLSSSGSRRGSSVSQTGIKIVSCLGIQAPLTFTSAAYFFKCTQTAANGDLLLGTFIPLNELMTQGQLVYRIFGQGRTGSGNTLSVALRMWDGSGTAQLVDTVTTTSTSNALLDTGWKPMPSWAGQASDVTVAPQVQLRAWNTGTASNGLVSSVTQLLIGLIPA